MPNTTMKSGWRNSPVASMGTFHSTYTTVVFCRSCGIAENLEIQFKTGVNFAMGIAFNPEEKIGVIDGDYAGIARVYLPTSGRCACGRLFVENLKGGTEGFAMLSGERDPNQFRSLPEDENSEETYLHFLIEIRNYGIISLKCTGRQEPKETICPLANEMLLTPPYLREDVEIGINTNFYNGLIARRPGRAIYYPFPYPSIRFWKHAALYFEEILVPYAVSSNISGTSWENFILSDTELQKHIAQRDLLEETKRYSMEEAVQRFSFDRYLDNVSFLIETGFATLFVPDIVNQQWILEMLDQYSSGPQHTSLFPTKEGDHLSCDFVSAGYMSRLRDPLISETPHLIDRLGRWFLDERLNDDAEIIRRTLTNYFAMKSIEFRVPSIEAKSFDDVWDFRERCRDELEAFRGALNQASQMAELFWDVAALKRADLSCDMAKLIDRPIQDFLRKGKSISRKFGEGFAFAGVKGGIPFVFSATAGLPLKMALLMSSATLAADAVQLALEWYRAQNDRRSESGIAYTLLLRNV
jgi:hypothetical protein